MRSDSICTGSPLCYYRIITKIIIFFLAWLYPYQRSEAQIIITEIMFDADTLENHNEYVEIYNAGAEPVSLLGWQLGDATETDAVIDAGWGMVLSTQQYAVILDPSYFNNSTIYDNLISDSALILTIEDASFGSYGWSNSVPEPVTLLNSVGDTIQIYFYSLDNLPGFSDEKIRLLPDNTPQNWANSAVFRGTPGYQNSVTPLNIDLQLDSIWIEPTFPISNQTFFLFASLINVGLQAIPDIDLVIFFDHNGNSFPDSTEIVHRESDLISLLPEENYEVNWEMPGLEAGHYLLGILAETAGDNNEDNNRKIISIEIEGLEKPIIINEIMYNPGSGAAEWIELYNKGIQNIDLDRWLIADSRDTIVIGRTTKILGSFDFMVLGEDSSILNAYGISGTHFIYVPSFPTLNNDADDLKLFSSSKSLQDRVTYSASWMRRQTSAGTSLERIHPEISSLHSLAKNCGARLRISRFRPSGRGKRSWDNLRLGKEELKVFSHWLSEHKDVVTGDSFFSIEEEDRKGLGLNLCGAAKFTCCVDPGGGVYPCAFLQDTTFYAGNLLKQSFGEIWSCGQGLNLLRNLKVRSCQPCFRFNPCRGGCPAVAYFTSRSLNTPDPECLGYCIQPS